MHLKKESYYLNSENRVWKRSIGVFCYFDTILVSVIYDLFKHLIPKGKGNARTLYL